MRPCVRQPQGAVRWNPQYNNPTTPAFVYVPGASVIDSARDSVSFSVTNPNYTGPRYLTNALGTGLRFYADYGGDNDDRLVASRALPTARAVAYTTVLAVRPLGSGGSYVSYLTANSSHEISIWHDGYVYCGYNGGNGYRRRHYVSCTPYSDTCIVVSSVGGKEVSAAVNGNSPYDSEGGVEWVGGGNSELSAAPTIGSMAGGWWNYYAFDGLLYLWAELPGVFIDQAQAVNLSRNPWAMFTERSWLYTGMGSGSWTPLEVEG